MGVVICLAVPPVIDFLIKNKHLDGFASNLGNTRAAKRLWCAVLGWLVLSRLQGAAAPRSKIVMTHVAAAHVLEAVSFGTEYLRFKSGGSPAIMAAIVAN